MIPRAFFCWTKEAAELIQSSQKYRQHGDGAFGNNLEVMYITNVTGNYSNHLCAAEEDPRRCTRAKVHPLKAEFVADAVCK